MRRCQGARRPADPPLAPQLKTYTVATQLNAGGAVCALIAEVARRFGPHLHAWRSGGAGASDASGGNATIG